MARFRKGPHDDINMFGRYSFAVRTPSFVANCGHSETQTNPDQAAPPCQSLSRFTVPHCSPDPNFHLLNVLKS